MLQLTKIQKASVPFNYGFKRDHRFLSLFRISTGVSNVIATAISKIILPAFSHLYSPFRNSKANL